MAKMGPAHENANGKTHEGKRRPTFEKSKGSSGGGVGVASSTGHKTKAVETSNAVNQDSPDFTVLDVKQEEFEKVSTWHKTLLYIEMQQKIPIKVGDEGGEIEGDPLKMALDRRKNEEVSRNPWQSGISLNNY